MRSRARDFVLCIGISSWDFVSFVSNNWGGEH